jgi:hypothetical protein
VDQRLPGQRGKEEARVPEHQAHHRVGGDPQVSPDKGVHFLQPPVQVLETGWDEGRERDRGEERVSFRSCFCYSGRCSLNTKQKKTNSKERDYLDLSNKKTQNVFIFHCKHFKTFSIACSNEHDSYRWTTEQIQMLLTVLKRY